MKYLLLLSAFVSSFVSYSQDIDAARRVIDTLCSPAYHGRGYVSDGHKKAAAFIAGAFADAGLAPVRLSYLQPFRVSVNTFPGNMSLSVEGRLLAAGSDFLPVPCSPSYYGSAPVITVDTNVLWNQQKWARFITHKQQTGKWLVIDETTISLHNEARKEYYELAKAMVQYSKEPTIAGIVLLQDRLTWHIAQESCLAPILYVKKSSWPADASSMDLALDARFIPSLLTQNVVGMIKGTEHPDSFLVFTGHYDHLGRIGEGAYIPGANDNASGIAMLIELAKYYAQHPPRYSVVFIAFGGEELGLVGSSHFTEEPWIPLAQIRFLVNLDIVGTGDEGIMVVNGKVFTEEADLLDTINQTHNYLPVIKRRQKAANSDHYFFTEKGVPSFFIYTMGGIDAYHDIYDRPETLPLTEFGDLYRLLIEFADSLSR